MTVQGITLDIYGGSDHTEVMAAVDIAPVGVYRRACDDCERSRLYGWELAAAVKPAGVIALALTRHTVLDGCGTCVGSTIVL